MPNKNSLSTVRDLISIDPGVRNLGWCHAHDGTIVAAGCSKLAPRGRLEDNARLHAHHVPTGEVCVLESMEVHRDRPGTPQDLIDVQTVGCLVAASVARTVHLYRPREWKGNVPKSIHHPRLVLALTGTEREIVHSAAHAAGKNNAKEVWDAVGLALFHLGRISRDGCAV